MATWRLPRTNVSYMVVDTRPNDGISTPELEVAPPGFLFNQFESSHPSKPLMIKADILVEWTSEETSINIDPTLPDTTLDALFEQDNSKKIQPEIQSSTSNRLDFQNIVQKAVKCLEDENDPLQKVVLSRYEVLELPKGFDAFNKFEELSEKYPNALCYSLQMDNGEQWLGATPEELIELVDKKAFKTVALAGTQRIGPDDKLGDIAWTQKEIEEQAMVSRYIIDCFKKIRLREFEEQGPKTVRAGKMAHLKTEFKVDMTATNTPNLGSTMLELLHPTSAVCGMPLERAQEFIKEHEWYEREFYAGFLGPVNIKNSTNLFVNLRCMKASGESGKLYAGAGITVDSDPEKEWSETELKLQTLKSVIFSS